MHSRRVALNRTHRFYPHPRLVACVLLRIHAPSIQLTRGATLLSTLQKLSILFHKLRHNIAVAPAAALLFLYPHVLLRLAGSMSLWAVFVAWGFAQGMLTSSKLWLSCLPMPELGENDYVR